MATGSSAGRTETPRVEARAHGNWGDVTAFFQLSSCCSPKSEPKCTYDVTKMATEKPPAGFGEREIKQQGAAAQAARLAPVSLRQLPRARSKRCWVCFSMRTALHSGQPWAALARAVLGRASAWTPTPTPTGLHASRASSSPGLAAQLTTGVCTAGWRQ